MTVLPSLGALAAAMALAAALETVVPLHPGNRRGGVRVPTNLALTALTFALNALLGAALAAALGAAGGFGLLRVVALPPLAAGAVGIVALDFAFWAAHVAMHARPALWRFHRVHHADEPVDVTTTFRQHPAETVVRYAFTASCALALGTTPGTFVVYRLASALNAILEHADLRVPPAVDHALSLVTTWPYVHKVHHSRDATETNTNYGNLFSVFDRAFGTFTPSVRGPGVAYGLD